MLIIFFHLITPAKMKAAGDLPVKREVCSQDRQKVVWSVLNSEIHTCESIQNQTCRQNPQQVRIRKVLNEHGEIIPHVQIRFLWTLFV